MQDLAFALDFSSSNYFASVFKKYTGRTPTEYRNDILS
ncbi:AraC family transcriptional regulator [Wocania arenilitoris]